MKTSKSNYRYPLATRGNLNYTRIATVCFFAGSFLLSSYYSYSPQLKECLADTTTSADYCFKKF
tara:strand:+ start:298 stop:489 length:192 start_codon:yes stop_codon:yes gene_type:complete